MAIPLFGDSSTSSKLITAALLRTLFYRGASSAIVIDGAYAAAYGAAASTVAFSPAAPEGNFGAPTSASDTTA